MIGVAAQEWGPAAYRPIPFARVLDMPRGVPPFVPGGVVTPGFQEDLVRTEATYTGNRRLAQTDARLMDAWIRAHHLKPDIAGASPREHEFTDGKTVAWVRMFPFVTSDGIRTVAAGGRMELYVHRIALSPLGPAAVALQARALSPTP